MRIKEGMTSLGHAPILGWQVFAGFISSCSREVWRGWWTNDIDELG